MRLLVTGGAGFIGGFTTRLLSRSGHEVTVVDDLSTGKAAAVGDAELVTADYADGVAMRHLLHRRRIEAVLHFAGLKSVAESWLVPERYRLVNVAGTAALLEAMAGAGVHALVYSGTCAIYGIPEALPVAENQRPAPLNPYGESKWLAELEIQRAAQQTGLRYCVLRYFNAAGAEMDGSAGEELEHATNLVPIVLKAALGLMQHVPVYGTDYPTSDGTAIRDYVHVLDLGAAHLRAVEYLADGGPSVALNLGTGRGTSVRQLLTAAERIVGCPIPNREEARREGDPPAIWADASRAGSVLDWQAQHGIDTILETAWKWARNRSEEPAPR